MSSKNLFKEEIVFDEKSKSKIKIKCYHDEDWKYKIEVSLPEEKNDSIDPADSEKCKLVEEIIKEMIDNSEKWKKLSSGAKTLSDLIPK
jgi:hypothetical protein